MADFWYGADAAFPKAVQWHNWYTYWSGRIERMQPLEKFVVDATMKLQQTMVKIAQRIRKNPEWTRQFTEDEMADIKAVAGEAAAWYRKNRPSDERIRNLDPCLQILFQGLDGAYAVSERLADELHRLNTRGFMLVDSAAELQETGS